MKSLQVKLNSREIREKQRNAKLTQTISLELLSEQSLTADYDDKNTDSQSELLSGICLIASVHMK